MEQNYQNHSRSVLGFHRILLVLLLAGLIGATVNLSESLHSNTLYSASLILLLFVCCSIMYAYVRLFPLKAQDRAIRAEENFRHYIVTGKPLSPELELPQIIALRFADDDELQELAARAVREKMSPKDIKLAIQKWKADHHRV